MASPPTKRGADVPRDASPLKKARVAVAPLDYFARLVRQRPQLTPAVVVEDQACAVVTFAGSPRALVLSQRELGPVPAGIVCAKGLDLPMPVAVYNEASRLGTDAATLVGLREAKRAAAAIGHVVARAVDEGWEKLSFECKVGRERSVAAFFVAYTLLLAASDVPGPTYTRDARATLLRRWALLAAPLTLPRSQQPFMGATRWPAAPALTALRQAFEARDVKRSQRGDAFFAGMEVVAALALVEAEPEVEAVTTPDTSLADAWASLL
jgi:hypothetical protein